MKAKLYVGINFKKQVREVFSSASVPTPESHPRYKAVIGPFRTRRGANYMANHGGNNPHLQCVADAERIAKENITN